MVWRMPRPAVLYSGLMDTPIKQIVHRPESQAGLGCMMCHSIANVKSTMGQADFYLEYPKLHEMAATQNPVARALHDFSDQAESRTAPPCLPQAIHEDANRGVLLHLPQGAPRCAGQSLSLVPRLQRIRQLAGQRSFRARGAVVLLPSKAATVRRLPHAAEASMDAGNVNGFVHSHRFPGANTAVPTANEDAAQLKLTEGFLKSGALTVDIFAVSPAQAPLKSGATSQSELATNVRCCEEAETKIIPVRAEKLRRSPPL